MVEIHEGTAVTGNLYGGYSGVGDANSNTVKIFSSASLSGSVYGDSPRTEPLHQIKFIFPVHLRTLIYQKLLFTVVIVERITHWRLKDGPV